MHNSVGRLFVYIKKAGGVGSGGVSFPFSKATNKQTHKHLSTSIHTQILSSYIQHAHTPTIRYSNHQPIHRRDDRIQRSTDFERMLRDSEQPFQLSDDH